MNASIVEYSYPKNEINSFKSANECLNRIFSNFEGKIEIKYKYVVENGITSLDFPVSAREKLKIFHTKNSMHP